MTSKPDIIKQLEEYFDNQKVGPTNVDRAAAVCREVYGANRAPNWFLFENGTIVCLQEAATSADAVEFLSDQGPVWISTARGDFKPMRTKNAAFKCYLIEFCWGMSCVTYVGDEEMDAVRAGTSPWKMTAAPTEVFSGLASGMTSREFAAGVLGRAKRHLDSKALKVVATGRAS